MTSSFRQKLGQCAMPGTHEAPRSKLQGIQAKANKTHSEREGIRISQLAELAEKKIPKGRLIEIENDKEKIVFRIPNVAIVLGVVGKWLV